MVAPVTIGARLQYDGTLLTAGKNLADDGFDEVTQSTHSVKTRGIYANELDEITLPGGAPSGGSILLNGTSQYLSLIGSTDYAFGNNPFTIEGWFYTTSTAYQRLWSFSNGDNVEIMGTHVYYWNGTAILDSGANVIGAYQWKHIALVKSVTVGVNSGNPVATVYVNGVAVITDNSPFDSGTSSRPFSIGGEGAIDVTGQDATTGADGFFTGNITNFRIVKGIAVYTNNFSTPIAPFTSTQNSGAYASAIPATYTKLLLRAVDSINLLTDGSQYTKSVTNSGGATFSALTPLSTAYNGKMKQQKSGELLVGNEFDEVTGIV
jgi:hypothetical protein